MSSTRAGFSAIPLLVTPLLVTLQLVACTRVADYPYMTEGQSHADAIVAAVARDWKPDPLVLSADPRMLEVFPEPKIKELVAACSRTLGAPKHQETLLSQTGVEVGTFTGKSALYVIKLACERGTATIRIKVHKVKDDWKVLGFDSGSRSRSIRCLQAPCRLRMNELQNDKMQQTSPG
jgi:hypothetical protein